MEAAAKSNLKKVCQHLLLSFRDYRNLRHLQVSLELGGKSPHLVFESADLEQGKYYSCLSIMLLLRQRLYSLQQICYLGKSLKVYSQSRQPHALTIVSLFKKLEPPIYRGPWFRVFHSCGKLCFLQCFLSISNLSSCSYLGSGQTTCYEFQRHASIRECGAC